MSKVLIIFAHPKFERSRTNKVLLDGILGMDDVTIHDLYEEYPDFHIDTSIEKDLLQGHDVLIWHHPFYWYSCPPLLKQWLDLVLEFGWAYGPGGNALYAKKCLNVITTGGSREVYCSEGTNVYSVNEFMRPFEQTARLCGMIYLPPFAVMGTHKLSDSDLDFHASQYRHLIGLLQQDMSMVSQRKNFLLNDIPELNNQ